MELRDRLQGIFPPVITNFDSAGEIAPIPFRENLRRWMETPIDGIVLFGSNGEGALLDEDEKVRLTGFARDVVPAGYVLIAGTSGESTRATARQARDLAGAGADVVLVHPPAYFGPYISVAAMMDHFRTVADASPVPVLLYHIPKYTKVTLEAGFVAELMRHPNVVGLKDSSGDMKRFADFTNACDRECRLFVGNGALLYTALELGAAGGILGVANIAPGLCADVVRHFREGRPQEAGRVQGRLTPLHREIVAAHGAVGCKAALDLMGWAGGAPRPPLRPLDDRERQQVARVMQEGGIL
ncbi:MAG TPA: dihydrodipicolinate synthase family protein [Longimicrobiales bacterium]|nr:dihydrodipicolinate synthase family protein [Longimicrobiales bacterium]